jgi:hypothetical protein
MSDRHFDETSEAAILSRLLEAAKRRLSPAAARYLLSLGFNEDEKARMHDLAVRNQDGGLTASEQEELHNYLRIGDLLALLHSTARRALKRKKVS